ncbi:hypothetical protein MFRU_005g01180 [Monilinia fructicola]|nr:hypothetical protein MFRU_005g01180 [Monilinia fructicola]
MVPTLTPNLTYVQFFSYSSNMMLGNDKSLAHEIKYVIMRMNTLVNLPRKEYLIMESHQGAHGVALDSIYWANVARSERNIEVNKLFENQNIRLNIFKQIWLDPNAILSSINYSKILIGFNHRPGRISGSIHASSKYVPFRLNRDNPMASRPVALLKNNLFEAKLKDKLD